MGSRYDEDRYQRVLAACALLPDLALLPAGDASEIGASLITISSLAPLQNA